MKTWVEISRSALQHNVRVLRDIAHPARIMAVVKSNAYGHGLVPVAKTLNASVAWFAVDSVEEGMVLRGAGIQKPILVIGYVPDDALIVCAKNKLSFVVYNVDSLKKIASLKAGKGAFRVHVPIETGMTREGFHGSELTTLLQYAAQLPSVTIEGTYMHFANSDDAGHPAYSLKQLQAYEQILARIKQLGIPMGSLCTTASSGAAMLFKQAHFSMIRPGMMLYGLWPSSAVEQASRREHQKISLRPALTWKTLVAQVKDVPKGTPIGYGMSERVKRPSKVAVLPVGYWDGMDRRLAPKGSVLIRGKRCKILGRICMNMCMVDVTDVPGVRPNDEVVLIGTQKGAEISAETFAETIGTINYEVVTRINPQIPRKLVK